MKRSILLVASLVLAGPLRAQSVADNVATALCGCLGQLPNADSLQARLRRCAPGALAAQQRDATAADQQLLSTPDGQQSVLRYSYERLPELCPEVARVHPGPLTPPGPEGKAKEILYYRNSASAEANRYYEAGNKHLKREDFRAAIKQYEKALAADPQFVYALDNLAISQRKLGRYDDARATYDRSLAIYPEGEVAILNQAVVYSLKQDWDNAAKYYELMRRYHPDSPEGYFGLGKLALLREDHEAAMTNLFKVHRMYVAAKSPYEADSKKLLVMLYMQMRKAEKTDLFLSRAKSNGINFEVTIKEKN